MNILVVHPEYPANREIVYMPLGLAHLSSVAERAGHTVKVLDMHNLRIPFRRLKWEIENNEYQVCMMGGFAMQVKSMAQCSRLIKQVQPECQVMLGGVGVSDIPEIALTYTRADAVAIGESETVLPKVLKSIEVGRPYEGTSGFVHRDSDGRIVKQPKGPVPTDLDVLPWPAYHLFDIDYISKRSYNGRGDRSIHILTSRGCPFRCDFCINSVLNSKELLTQIHGEVQYEAPKTQRFRDTRKLVEEIQFLRSEYGITDFHFADEEFITHRRRLEEVCAAVEPLGITWSTSGRADWANDERLARMKRAGCQYVLFGVETGSQTMLDLMQKHAKKTSVTAGLNAARNVGLSFIANFMIGHPGETETTVKETVDFCKEHGLICLPSFVTLFPNSRMFHDFAMTIRNWDDYFDGLSKVDYSTRLFKNLTDLPDWKVKYLRNWAIAETCSSALAPQLPALFHAALTRILQLAVFASDHSPNRMHWLVRNVFRNIFDFGSRKHHSSSGTEALAQQVPPNDIGQEGHASSEDAYEQSLTELIQR